MQENLSVDKPSLHWSQDYYLKVNKNITKNSEYNFSGKNSVYKKVPHFYSISFLDFLPIFIGWLHSLFSLSVTYGLIKSTTIFNKELYNYFKWKFFFASFIHYLFGPILIFLILLLCPLIGLSSSELFGTWGQVIRQFFSLNGPYEAFNTFNDVIVKSFFGTNAWWITLLIFIFLPCLNVSTFFSKLIMNPKNDKWMKLVVLQNELKMKLTNFERKRG